MKIHKPGCLANVSCLVVHTDGVCPGPYGKCTCEGSGTNITPPMSKLDELDEEFEYLFVRNPAEIEGVKRVEWRQLCSDRVEAAKSFVRKYYDLGKLEEREATKKVVLNQSSKIRKDALSDLLNKLK